MQNHPKIVGNALFILASKDLLFVKIYTDLLRNSLEGLAGVIDTIALGIIVEQSCLLTLLRPEQQYARGGIEAVAVNAAEATALIADEHGHHVILRSLKSIVLRDEADVQPGGEGIFGRPQRNIRQELCVQPLHTLWYEIALTLDGEGMAQFARP